MKVSPAKENILKKIRQALSQTTPVPFPQSEGSQSVYPGAAEENDLTFAEQFGKVGGKFVYCESDAEMAAQIKALAATKGWTALYCREAPLRAQLDPALPGFFDQASLADCDAAITGCEALVARTGSILMSAAQESGRSVSVYAPVHICIAYPDQLVYDIRDGLEKVRDRYGNRFPSLLTLATGPSRTADIEKTLVVGVHGPKEVYAFLVDKP